MPNASTLENVKTAIGELSTVERSQLLDWLAQADLQRWDKQLEDDFSDGGAGMRWLEQVDREIDRGEFSEVG